jgi:membrane fusion protein, multidrug efflux system
VYMRKLSALCVLSVCLVVTACQAGSDSAKSMNQLYAEKGRPVRIRSVTPEVFSVDLKFPAEFRARSQSTAYAKVSDVVRDIRVTVGERVVQDQVVLSFSMDTPSYRQAKLSFRNAESSYRRIETLYREAGVSRQNYDNALTQYEMARESFKAASDMVQVKAPISGTITQLNVRESANVSAGAPLFTISNQDGYEALFYVTANEIADIQTGSSATISGTGETINGKVTEVTLIMDPVKKAFPVKAFFTGRPKTLVSGMSVDISVESYRNDRAIVVARKEMILIDGAWFVYVQEGETAVLRAVQTGRGAGLDFEIASGLKAGDALVCDGVKELSDGDKIRLVDSGAATGAASL